MTRKADFNAEEWSLVLEGPLLAALRVIGADRGGTLRESLSVGRAYAQARQEGGSELVNEIVADRPDFDPGRLGGDDPGAAAVERLREAVGTVEAKATPEEAAEYKRFALNIAEIAADAHKEGSFLGIGGKEVSDAEQAALDELRSVLGAGA